MNAKIICIIGPTSSGKTSTAIALSKKLDGEIISVDSRQIYKHMDIGTGKLPTNKSQKDIKKSFQYWIVDGVTIWGYDLALPNEFYSSFDYLQFTVPKIKELLARKKTPILAGGTGFYFDMLFGDKKMSEVEPDLKLREELENMMLEELQEKLKDLDRDYYDRIDNQNPARLIRAVEISLNGKKKQMNKEKKDVETVFNNNNIQPENTVKIGFTATRKYLYDRADNWAEQIWKNGLLEETNQLMNSGYKDSKKLEGLVYKTAVEYILGKKSEKQAIQRIKWDLHAYIRGQQTYFKKMKDIIWIDIEKNNSQDKKLEKLYNIING